MPLSPDDIQCWWITNPLIRYIVTAIEVLELYSQHPVALGACYFVGNKKRHWWQHFLNYQSYWKEAHSISSGRCNSGTRADRRPTRLTFAKRTTPYAFRTMTKHLILSANSDSVRVILKRGRNSLKISLSEERELNSCPILCNKCQKCEPNTAPRQPGFRYSQILDIE
jgi:hypothetical protein